MLELIVEAYIATAEPVGSAWVSRKFRPALSSATIRNIMGQLEEAGLLQQPHTSAGRVPTERGWRFYVDSLMSVHPLSAETMRQLEHVIHPEGVEVEQVLERASDALADMTQQAAFVVAPTVRRRTVKQVELVPLGVHRLLCILIANEEMVASHVVEIEESITRDELASLARFINTELAGLSCASLLESLERRMLAESDSFYYLVKRSLDILQHALSTEPEERLLLEGTSFVVAQPEFSRDARKAHALLRGLDAEELLLERIRQDLHGRGVHVRIGREIRLPGLEECSYVLTSFGMGGEVVGGVGVIGPKRMDYPRLRSLVEGMGRCLTDVLSRWGDEA